MAKRIFGVALILSGGLVFLAALAMGIAGIPSPGWGYLKILLALFGLAAAAAGVLLREWADRNGAQNRGTRLFAYGCMFNAVLSILPRLPFLGNISSWWRSSHTLLTSYWFQQEGIDLVHYQTPVFGPPWRVPLEFPLYQAVCAVVSTAARIDLTLSSRLVTLAVFYLTALLLLLLCLQFTENRALSFVVLTVFLWLPFNIRYSIEPLPDFLSVLLALCYLYGIGKWVESPRRYGFFAFAAITGCLAAMVKITTMPIIILPAVWITLNGMREWGVNFRDWGDRRKIFAQARTHGGRLALLAVMASAPLLAGVWWVKLSDSIKQGNLYTLWLTSANSYDWYVGPLAQKLSYSEWLGKFRNLRNCFFIGPILVFPLLAAVCLYRLPAKSRFVFGSALAGALLTIFLFFNLYLHEYYYISVSALVSVLLGFGFYGTYVFVLRRNVWWHVFAGLVLWFVLLAGVEQYAFQRKTADDEVNHQQSAYIPLAEKVAEITPEGGYVITFQWDWYADFLFFARRKGLIITPREEPKFTCESVTPYRYTTVVVVDGPADAPGVSAVLKCFGSVEEVEPGLWTVEP